MPDLLEDLRRTKATSLVFVVGTGVAVGALGGSPHALLATWTGLLDHGLRRTHDIGRIDAPTLSHYQRQLGLTGPIALLGVADAVADGLDAPHGGEFSRWLRETVGTFHPQVRDHSVLEALAAHQRRGVLLATTNYDHLLEAATGLKPTTWRRASVVERAIKGLEPRVLHLHGEWEDPESIVLGTRSYVDVARDEHALAVLTALRTDRTFVFVGCGAGLRDPNLGAFVEWSARAYASTEGRHFRLCLNSELEELRREHPRGQRIFPISYGDDHADLADFLRGLLLTDSPNSAPPRPASPTAALRSTESDPIELTGSWERELHTLLATAISPAELRWWARYQYTDMSTILPPMTHMGSADFAGNVVEGLIRCGHISGDFFDRLAAKLDISHGPRIDAIRVLWRGSVASTTAGAVGSQPNPAAQPAPSATSSPARTPAPGHTTPRIALVLDRIEQWGTIRQHCNNDTSNLAFIVHGTCEQNVVHFAERIERFLNDPEEDVLKHHIPRRVERRENGKIAILAGEWANQTIAATELGITKPDSSLESALALETRKRPVAFIYLEGGAPLHDLGRDGLDGLTRFLSSELPKAIAVAKVKNPLRFFFVIEDNRSLAQAIHEALCHRNARDHIKVHEILELTFPPWHEVEKYIHAEFGAVHDDTRDDCKRCYEAAVKAGDDLRTLADSLKPILENWFEKHG